MKRPLVVLDTSALLLLLSRKQDDSPAEVEADRRREATRQTLHDMQAKFRFGIPAVVVAELGRDGPAAKALRKLVATVGRFRILPLTHSAGAVAADLAGPALRQRNKNDVRGAVKFDTLICATAIAHEAEAILTEDARGFPKYLAYAKSSIEVIVPSEPPKKGQLLLMQKQRNS